MKERNYIAFLAAAVVFFTGVLPVYAAENKGQYVEKKGKFSIAIPDSWQAIEIKKLRYKILRGAFENGFAPTINFTDETFKGQFDAYVSHINEELDKLYGENIERILQSDFATSKGLKGKIIVITTYQQEMLIQQSYFCFPASKGKYITITCTSLAAEHEKYNALFHETVKTFALL